MEQHDFKEAPCGRPVVMATPRLLLCRLQGIQFLFRQPVMIS